VDDRNAPIVASASFLLAVQLIGSPSISHELAVRATRQVDMTTEASPAVSLAVAAVSPFTTAFE
jgi:hypothetical protein